jgi:hypothetical protein
MSVGTLSDPQVESQPWASLYSNNLTTQGFQLTPGAALGKVLTSNALGVASWQVPSIPMNDSAIWRPGMPSSPPFVNLWSEVVFAIGQGVRNVYVDTTFAPAEIKSVGMPIGGWNMLGVTFYSLSSNFASRATINFDPAAILVDVIGFSGFFHLNLQSTVPTFAFTNNQAIIFSFNCQVNILAGTTSSPIVLNTLFVAVGFEMSSTLVNDVLLPFIHMTNGSSCVVDTIFNSMSPSPFYSGSLIDGDGSGNTFLYIYDASNPPFTTSLPGDTVISHPIDAAGSVSYDDTLVPPTTGATTVQTALDYFKVNGDTVYPLLAPDGTAAAPSYSFAADSGTGLYRDGKASMGLTCGGSEILEVSSSALTVTPGIPMNLGGELVLTGGQNISGLQTITVESGVNFNLVDGSSNTQLSVPAVGDQVQITNTLQLGSGGITNAGLITTQGGGMILQNPSSEFIFQVGNDPLGSIGFFGAPPIHPGGSYHDTSVVSTGATPAFVENTYDGGVGGSNFTIGGLVLALKQLGLIGP